MTRPQIVTFFSELDSDLKARNPERLANWYAEDATVNSPMFKRLSRRKQITESYYRLFETFPDWTIINEEPLIDGDRVALPFQGTATHRGEFMGLPGTGRKFQIEGVRIFRMGDGLIQDERRIYDFTSFLIQIGVLRSKPGY